MKAHDGRGGPLLDHGVDGNGLLGLERVKKVLTFTRQYLIDVMHAISFKNLELPVKGL